MDGNKALYLESLCRSEGWQYTRFDYSGTGNSEGEFEKYGIDHWLEDACLILDQICAGPQIVVGSSMGGWIATLLAEKRPARIVALMGIASAPDFTEELIWKGLSPDGQAQLSAGKVLERPNRYEPDSPRQLSMEFILSGRRCLVLDKSLSWDGPVRLLHGTADLDVPSSLSQRLLLQLNSHDAQLTLVKDADHRFSTDDQLKIIGEQLRQLYQLCE
ncbi:MAG: alpha/beta hydrolase [Gammaproteobacteria bacterium]|nr:alpha/beta hydrolase [Gammaproteobacteria bacterium]